MSYKQASELFQEVYLCCEDLVEPHTKQFLPSLQYLGIQKRLRKRKKVPVFLLEHVGLEEIEKNEKGSIFSAVPTLLEHVLDSPMAPAIMKVLHSVSRKCCLKF